MAASPELHQLGRGDFIWHTYDPGVKAELFSTGLATEAGVYLIDPIPVSSDLLSAALDGGAVCGIVITNANHRRNAAAAARAAGVPLYAHADAGLEAEHTIISAASGDEQLGGVEAISIRGAADGEIALHRRDAHGGTLVVGDAVINAGSYGFTLLPPKYCTNPKQLPKSLAKLLHYEFERILFAHGTPILKHGRARLAELLDGHR